MDEILKNKVISLIVDSKTFYKSVSLGSRYECSVTSNIFDSIQVDIIHNGLENVKVYSKGTMILLLPRDIFYNALKSREAKIKEDFLNEK